MPSNPPVSVPASGTDDRLRPLQTRDRLIALAVLGLLVVPQARDSSPVTIVDFASYGMCTPV